MKRFKTQARSNWQKIVSDQGLTYHTINGIQYWDETAIINFQLKK